MADALWINASAGAPAYSANELRQAMALGLMYGGRLLGARQGVRPGGDQLKVSLSVSTITVQPGVACIDPGLTTPQGPYWVAIPAAETHTLTPADATNPRKDIVILRVYDHDEDLSGLRTALSEYLVGTPGPSPAEPATPAGAIVLAGIDVPASGGGAAVVTDRRPYTAAPGGILSVGSQAERDALSGYNSLAVYRRDTKNVEFHDGTGWFSRYGWVAEGVRTSSVGPFSTTETVVQSLTFTAVAGLRYKITALQHYQSSVAGDIVQLRLRWAAGASVAITDTQIDSIRPGCSVAARNELASPMATLTGASGQVTVGVTAVRSSGTGNITMEGFSTTSNRLLVEAV